jgi:hypothetical protein
MHKMRLVVAGMLVGVALATVAAEELRQMRFSDPSTQAGVALALKKAGISVSNHDSDGLYVPSDQWASALAEAMAWAQKNLPVGRSASWNEFLSPRIETRMTDRGIPYEVKCVAGVKWIIWPDKYSASVREIEAGLVAELLEALKAGQVSGHVGNALCI